LRLFVTGTKVILLVASPFLAIGYGSEVVDLARKSSFVEPLAWFGLGCVFFIPTWWLCQRYLWNAWEFICTLEHELTHAIVGLPFLLIPRGMRVTATRGGHVKQIWIGPTLLMPLYGPGRVLSSLAPYFLPTISYVLIVWSLVIPDSKTPWFFVIFGFATTFHIVSTWAETHFRQPDLQESGIIFSAFFLPVANLITMGSLVAFISTGATGFWHYWIDGFSRSLEQFFSVIEFAKR
jgi:hypothetical protein